MADMTVKNIKLFLINLFRNIIRKLFIIKIFRNMVVNANELFIMNRLRQKKDKLKLKNFLMILADLKKRRVYCKGYPVWLTIDPTNICNLKCPFCPTGNGGIKRPKGMMNKENFEKIMNMLGPYLLHIDMMNWGEPLLHKDIYQMISYAKKFDIHITLSTNFQVFFDEKKSRKYG